MKVAEIAAKAMNNYLMFGRQLDVHVVDNAHKDTFKHGNRDWKFVPTKQIFRSKKNNEEKSTEDRKARVLGLLQKEKEKRDRLKELEIDYSFPGYQALYDAHKAANSKKSESKSADKPKDASKKKKSKSKK